METHRVTPALVVFGAHALLIYAVATSLGFLEVPSFVRPMTAEIIDTHEKLETPETPTVEPVIDSTRSSKDIPVPLPDYPFPEAVPEPGVPALISTDPVSTEPLPSAAQVQDVVLAVTRRVDPSYPPMARRLGEEGSVTLRVLVDEGGRATEVQVSRSSGYPRLDEAAAQAVRRWAFRPATQASQATRAWTSVKVTFRLDQQ